MYTYDSLFQQYIRHHDLQNTRYTIHIVYIVCVSALYIDSCGFEFPTNNFKYVISIQLHYVYSTMVDYQFAVLINN